MLINVHLTQIATICTIALAAAACTPSESATNSATEMANPASVNCVKVGGKLNIKRTPQGEFGMCQLPSGKVCEEWALFRGQCS